MQPRSLYTLMNPLNPFQIRFKCITDLMNHPAFNSCCAWLLFRNKRILGAQCYTASLICLLARLVMPVLIVSIWPCLGAAFLVTFPNDIGVRWQGKNPLDCLTVWGVRSMNTNFSRSTYRILMFRPPSFLVQMLNTSSPLRTLTTAPHTSSPASAN